ncbi:MAG TPA: hypothetical protein VE621_21885 [Bryobacteraceae bacterium]|jgi:hypothetical protein|nr:hypothetical protein [Bryobacteraceae bacterium]
MRALSARAVRDTDDEDLMEVWAMSMRPNEEALRRPVQNPASTAAFGFLIVLALLIGSMGLIGPTGTSPQISSVTAPIEEMRRVIRNHAAVKYTDKFDQGIRHWMPVGNGRADWTFRDGFAQPARLRLWRETLNMTDYQLEFVTQLEKKGVGWAYRASDENNYYAGKLSVTRPGALPKVDLLRYAVVDGSEGPRVSQPIPLVLREDTLYRVVVNVRGANFNTTVNGKMVDVWSDKRLASGGIGFFADKGELATLRWVTISHRDDFLGRLLSYIGLIQPIQPLRYTAVLPVAPF